MYLGPMTFKEVFKAKPWGGRALARVANKELPLGEPIGESWELSDHPHGMSVVRDGPVAGKSLRDLMRRHGVEMLGRKPGNDRFPLLIKILDAREQLSVQVHPNDAIARAMELRDPGKTEAWVILHAGRQARMVTGLKSKADIPNLMELARSGGIAERLRTIQPHTGDALLCRAGAVHALGPDTVLLEVQQNSDSTFRLYDWGRMGLDGKPRKLHLTEAQRAVGKSAQTVSVKSAKKLKNKPFPAERLVRCDKFVMDRWQIAKCAKRAKGNAFEILHIVEGQGRLTDGVWPSVRLAKGRTVLVPACVGAYTIAAVKPLVLICVAERG